MRLSADRAGLYAALLLAGLLAATSVRQGAFAAAFTDASGYVSAGDLWRRGEIFRPEPQHFWATWPQADIAASPFGYRAGAIRGTEASVYPAGFPLLIAAATSIAGPLGAYVVAPAMGGLLVLCTFLLGRQLAGTLAGLMAAGLIASTPATLLHTVHPMSDVPAAACWLLGWVLALRARTSAALAAGTAVALAIVIRPNLAPLASVIGGLVLVGGTTRLLAVHDWHWRRALVFTLAAAIGPAMVMWTQAVLYGGPFTPGYVEWETFYRVEHIAANLRLYPRLLSQMHTLVPAAGFLLALAAWTGRPRGLAPSARLVARSAGAMALVNLALLLPYLALDHWSYLRFLLPGLAAMFVLFAGGLVLTARAVAPRTRLIAAAIPLMAVIVVWKASPLSLEALRDWQGQGRTPLMGRYLREVLPSNAMVLSSGHSGAVAHYTGREILRLDAIAAQPLDAVVDELVRRGYRPVLVIDDLLESNGFKYYFKSSRYAALDWPPRARFTSQVSIVYFDLADRDRHLAGARWPIDVVR